MFRRPGQLVRPIFPAICIFGLIALMAGPASGQEVTVTETFLGKITDDIVPFSITFSPDGRRLAYLEVWNDETVVILDGQEAGRHSDEAFPSELYEEWSTRYRLDSRSGGGGCPHHDPTSVIFSPDSKRTAHITYEDDKAFVVLDGNRHATYDDVSSLRFSADSRRIAYVATVDGQDFVVVDGQELARYDSIQEFGFSPDSQCLAFIARTEDGESVLSREGHPDESYDRIETPGFAATGNLLPYVVSLDDTGKEECLFVNGVEISRWPYIDRDSFRHAPAGERYACHATSTGPDGDTQISVIVDGKVAATFPDPGVPLLGPDDRVEWARWWKGAWDMYVSTDDIYSRLWTGEDAPTAAQHLLFSPDGRRLAYTIWRNGKVALVVDGKAGPFYEVIGDVVFSPDSSQLAYVAGEEEVVFVVSDGISGDPHDDITELRFSDNGEHLAYVVDRDDQHILIVDHMEELPFKDVSVQDFAISPDGRHVVARVLLTDKEERRFCAYYDGELGTRYEAMNWAEPIALSPDGQRFGYVACRTEGGHPVDGRNVVVLDGRQSVEEYRWAYLLQFSPDGKHFIYMASAGDNELALFVDGVVRGTYGTLARDNEPTFTDANHLHFIAEKNREFLRVDITFGPAAQP